MRLGKTLSSWRNNREANHWRRSPLLQPLHDQTIIVPGFFYYNTDTDLETIKFHFNAWYHSRLCIKSLLTQDQKNFSNGSSLHLPRSLCHHLSFPCPFPPFFPFATPASRFQLPVHPSLEFISSPASNNPLAPST
jgi:hypothetical protein